MTDRRKSYWLRFHYAKRWRTNGTLYSRFEVDAIEWDVADSLVEEFGLPRSGLQERTYVMLHEDYICD